MQRFTSAICHVHDTGYRINGEWSRKRLVQIEPVTDKTVSASVDGPYRAQVRFGNVNTIRGWVYCKPVQTKTQRDRCEMRNAGGIEYLEFEITAPIYHVSSVR